MTAKVQRFGLAWNDEENKVVMAAAHYPKELVESMLAKLLWKIFQLVPKTAVYTLQDYIENLRNLNSIGNWIAW